MKLFRLEKRRNVLQLGILLTLCAVGTSVVYVVTSLLASVADRHSMFDVECVQGLSGALFALKVVVLSENEFSIW